MDKAVVASLKERSELLLEQLDEAKQKGKDDTQKYRDMQQCYLKTSGAYIAMVNAENQRRMQELGIKPTGKAKPLTEAQLRGLGISDESIRTLKKFGCVRRED